MAEARALCDGLNLAIQAGFDHFIVECDNKVVIQATEGNIHIPWQIHYIIKDIEAWNSQGIQIRQERRRNAELYIVLLLIRSLPIDNGAPTQN